MTQHYAHLGVYSDWAGVAAGPRNRATRLPAAQLRQLVGTVLSFPDPALERSPPAVHIERRWTVEGLDGEELSYSVGYGPPTKAWVLKPAGVRGTLPGVLVLHSHDGFKYYGKEKVADGPDPTPDVVAALRTSTYGGRAFAIDLARRGFVVLVPDVFGWGSRRFPCGQMPPLVQELGKLTAGNVPPVPHPARCRPRWPATTPPPGITSTWKRSTAPCSAPLSRCCGSARGPRSAQLPVLPLGPIRPTAAGVSACPVEGAGLRYCGPRASSWTQLSWSA